MARRNLLNRWATPPGWKAADGCTILGCGRKGIARGMCWNHYQRARRGLPVFVYLSRSGERDTVLAFGPPRPSYSVRRMARLTWEAATLFTPCPNTGCHLWLGEYHPNGYGLLGRSGDPWGRWAHRAVLYFSGVPLRDGHEYQVRHLCNNTACVNVAHLAYSRAWENARDRAVVHGHISIDPEAVALIKRALVDGESCRSLADRFGVNTGTIYSIKYGNSWRWVEPAPIPELPNPQQSAA